MKITTLDIEIAIAARYGSRRNLIVPNVSWGLGIHGCDLLVMHPSGYCEEIEIKISKSDLLNDLKKPHQHRSNKIRRFWYAVPNNLIEVARENIPSHAGLYQVYEENNSGYLMSEVVIPAKINKTAVKLSTKEQQKLAHLGCMRIWSLKRKIKSYMRTIDIWKHKK